MPYFAVRRSLALEHFFGAAAPAGGELQALEARLVGAPGRIVVLADAAETGPQASEFERAHAVPAGALGRFFAERRPQLLADDPAVGRLWLLTAP